MKMYVCVCVCMCDLFVASGMSRNSNGIANSFQNNKTPVDISQSLQQIIRDVAEDESSILTLQDALRKIEDRKCTAVQFYLRAMSTRLDIVP